MTHVANSESLKKVVCWSVWFILPGNLEQKKREKFLVIGAPRCATKFKFHIYKHEINRNLTPNSEQFLVCPCLCPTSDLNIRSSCCLVCVRHLKIFYLPPKTHWLAVSKYQAVSSYFMRPHRGYYIDKTQRLQVDYRVARNWPKTSFTFGLEHLVDNAGNMSQFQLIKCKV